MIRKHSIISRMIMVFLAFATVGGGLYVGSMLLEPVVVPPPIFGKAKVAFDTSADVSAHPVFQALRPLGPNVVAAGALGRINPFAPIPLTATSTREQATTTEPEPITGAEPTPTPEEILPTPDETPPVEEGAASPTPTEEPAVESPPPTPNPTF